MIEQRAYLRDCMDAMAEFPDKFFDLAVVDPPYGIGIVTEMDRSGFDPEKKIKNSLLKFESSMKEKKWDNAVPDKNYWKELFRVSKNQVIWGGNYFLDHLPKTRCFIVWDKMTYVPTMAQIELAWTSFKKHSVLKKINSNQLDRFHPTQKPVALYDWIFANYAKPGQKILDTHLGSGSSRIAANKAGLDFWGYELDTDYFAAHEKRYANFIAQLRLF